MAYGGKVPVIRKTDDEMGKQTNKQKHPMLGPGDKKKEKYKREDSKDLSPPRCFHTTMCVSRRVST